MILKLIQLPIMNIFVKGNVLHQENPSHLKILHEQPIEPSEQPYFLLDLPFDMEIDEENVTADLNIFYFILSYILCTGAILHAA